MEDWAAYCYSMEKNETGSTVHSAIVVEAT